MTHTIAQLFDLTGKSALVTGGAMGIGGACAIRLAEAGASVMISDIDMKAAGQTVEQIEDRGGRGRSIHADVANMTDAHKAVQATVEAFGHLDILVNNAAIYFFTSVLQMSEKKWDRLLDINLKGLFFYSQVAAQEMIKAGNGGKIINMAAVGAITPIRGDLAHYAASKGGVISLTKALALELAPYNILVNAVAPGGIMTPGGVAQGAAIEASGESLEEHTRNFVARLPLHRIGEPDDVAKVVLFLASEAADYITGSLLPVDGGYLLS